MLRLAAALTAIAAGVVVPFVPIAWRQGGTVLALFADGPLTGVTGIIAALCAGVGGLLGVVLSRYFPFRLQMERLALKHVKNLLQRQDTLMKGFVSCIRAVVHLGRECREDYREQRVINETFQEINRRQNEVLQKAGLPPIPLSDLPPERVINQVALDQAETFLREAEQISVLMAEAGKNALKDIRGGRKDSGEIEL